jgi:hypothetical protein
VERGKPEYVDKEECLQDTTKVQPKGKRERR